MSGYVVPEFRFGFDGLPHTEGMLILGSDLSLWITSGKTNADGVVSNVPQVWAMNSDGEPLALLAQGRVPLDGATLALLAELARRAFPGHAAITA